MFHVKHIYAGGVEKCALTIYLNLSDTKENYILSKERIISSKWISYYECNILYLLDDCGFLTLVI